MLWRSVLPDLDEDDEKTIVDTRVPSLEDPRVPSFEDPRVPSFEDLRVRSFEDTPIPSFEDTPIPSFEDPPEPKHRWGDSKAGVALSLTLRPLAAGLRSFSLVYPLSMLALAIAGIAWYLAQTAPPESRAAASSLPEVAAPATTASASTSVEVPQVAPPATTKRSIDVMSLPTAPPAIAPPASRTKPSPRTR